jgi:hypothetical protein
MRVFWLAALGAATLVACGGGGGGGSGGTSTTAVPLTGNNMNPDGIAYPNPAGGYGHTARVGTTPGSVMQNFKFYGFPNGDMSKGLQPISLSDYYDPCSKRYSLLRLSVAGVWCVPCNEETDAIVAAQATLTSERVVVIQALGDGPTMGVGATVSDLQGWVTKHDSKFTEMLDPGLVNLGSFFNASAIPWNCDIDPRTMEILQAATGWSGDLSTDLALPLAQATAGPPGYPITASCN